MNKTKLVTFFMLIILLALSTGLMAYSGGSGTSGDPYQIATTADLIELSTTSGDWGIRVDPVYFEQTENIVFDSNETLVDWDGDGTTWGDDETDDEAGFSPIGNFSNNFIGSYDGDGYTIANLFINRPSTNRIGLFGYTDGSSISMIISNIGVTNVDITGDTWVGGLVGENHWTNVSNSYSTGSVTGTYHVGGLVGYNYNSNVSNSYSTGSVSGYSAGGLVGVNVQSSIVSNSYSTGSVTISGDNGGLVGENSATVSNSFWDTQTSGQSSSDGGTGKITDEMKTTTTFTGAGWDFTTTPIWDRVDNQNGGYPHLDSQTFPRAVTFSDGSSFNPGPTQGETDQAYQLLRCSNYQSYRYHTLFSLQGRHLKIQ